MSKMAEVKAVKKFIHEEIQKCFSVSEICEKYKELLYCGDRRIEVAVLKEVVDRGWGKAPLTISVAQYTPELLETDDEQDEQLKQLLLSSLPHIIEGESVQKNPSSIDLDNQAEIDDDFDGDSV